jgi:hypothetical protein
MGGVSCTMHTQSMKATREETRRRRRRRRERRKRV